MTLRWNHRVLDRHLRILREVWQTISFWILEFLAGFGLIAVVTIAVPVIVYILGR